MPACSFCKSNYEFPRGTTVVQKDGTVRYFCSSKCRKNSQMGRQSKKVKWVRKSELVKGEKAKKDAFNLAKKEARDAEEKVKKEKKAASKASKKERKESKKKAKKK